MRTFLLIAPLMLLIACGSKKNYTCTCRSSNFLTENQVQRSNINDTKERAKVKCEGKSSIALGNEKTCTLQ